MSKNHHEKVEKSVGLLGIFTVIAISFSIVAVFAPVGFMSGIAGQYFKQFGLTVAVSVLFSLLVARIVTPMLVPALIAVGVIVAILNYNELLFATFLTQSEDVQTVPVLLAGMLSERVQDFGRIAASSLLAVVPVFTIAVLLQRYLIEGLTSGAMK